MPATILLKTRTNLSSQHTRLSAGVRATVPATEIAGRHKTAVARIGGNAATLTILLCLSLLLTSCKGDGRALSREAAHAELRRRGIERTSRAFVESAKTDDAALIKVFLDAGIDPDARADSGRTALMSAAESGNEAALNALLARGATLTLVDDDGRSALHWAAGSYRGYSCVRSLLNHGADPCAKTPAGETPLTAAIYLPRLDPSASVLASFDYLDTIKVLLDHGAEVNAQNTRGLTPLMRASVFGDTRIVQLLIDRGADVRAVDNEGNTALKYAQQYNNIEAAKVIEQAGG